MNKTLQTVYVPTENTIASNSWYIKKDIINVSKVKEQQAILLTQEEYDTLIQENTYLKAEFEANKDKVYTQEEYNALSNDKRISDIITDIEFLRDRADELLVKVAYNMAIVVIKSTPFPQTPTKLKK